MKISKMSHSVCQGMMTGPTYARNIVKDILPNFPTALEKNLLKYF